MKAVVCTRYGAPDVLEIKEVPTPAVTATDLLVRVHASAVNSADVRSRSLDVSGPMKIAMRLLIGWKAPRQPVLGTVFSGEVVGLGECTSGFQLGDRVYGCSPGLRYGCHAEYMTIKADSTLAQMPKNAHFEEAVALLFGGTTALFFLERAKAQTGQSLLVYGASGAVGSAAVQVGAALGLEVAGVSSGANELLVRSLGASNFIDYTKEDYTLNNLRYDIVLDAVGKTSRREAQKVLKPGGQFLTVGGATVAKESRAQICRLSDWYDQGKFKAVIDRKYPMEEATEAHRYVDQGHKKGNVILTMPIQSL